MNSVASPEDLRKRYTAGLDAYLAAASETELLRAHELGRAALTLGLGTLDITGLFGGALERAIADAPPAADRGRLARLAATFLAETLSPFEMTRLDYRNVNAELARLIEERTRALNESEVKARAILDTAPDGIITFDEGGVIEDVNPAAERIFGYERAELIGRDLAPLVKGGCRALIRAGAGTLETGDGLRRDGTAFPLEFAVSEVKLGDRSRYTAIVRDVTARRQLEGQLLQAQRLESLGTLAGGVAHDFNNLMTTVLGIADLHLMPRAQVALQREDWQEVRDSAARATKLTQQLLSFSRRQIAEPRVVSLNDVVRAVERMLRRVIGEDIDLTVRLAPGLWKTEVDPGLFEQVLVNLAVNARHAMPHGGRLTIETENVRCPVEGAEEAATADCVLLTVTDTGQGMSAAVRARCFEPFFTTKELGKGTGLGLATCYGIIEQAGGDIHVDSEPDQGASFRIYLPRAAAGRAPPQPHVDPPAELPCGSEVVLLVEDERVVRELTARVLRHLGYFVLEAADGNEALRVAGVQPDAIDLVLTDVVMPEIGGKELGERLADMGCRAKLLYTSGYADETIARAGVAADAVDFLQKPYSPSMLAAKVRDVLSRPGR